MWEEAGQHAACGQGTLGGGCSQIPRVPAAPPGWGGGARAPLLSSCMGPRDRPGGSAQGDAAPKGSDSESSSCQGFSPATGSVVSLRGSCQGNLMGCCGVMPPSCARAAPPQGEAENLRQSSRRDARRLYRLLLSRRVTPFCSSFTCVRAKARLAGMLANGAGCADSPGSLETPTLRLLLKHANYQVLIDPGFATLPSSWLHL